MNLPTGTVTFLFTDIEGSVRLWEEHPESMGEALARHDALLHEAVARHDGQVYKTAGDAFCTVFSHPERALAAALAAQRALVAEPWPTPVPLRVRMALHTGAVESVQHDYFGPTVHRAARILGVAHGGQTLVAESTRALCRSVPDGAQLLPLGERRLRDMAQPVVLYQLAHPELPAAFPPLNSLDNPGLPNNLPLQITAFIGRETEIAAARALLAASRVVTLVGAGGCGKTRLALQVAAEALDTFEDGVWFVELAALRDPERVAPTVEAAVGIQERPGESAAHALARAWADKRLLLVLDNGEHLRAACAELIDPLLRACPGVKVLATSRQALGADGEAAYRVPSLAGPDAVRLFVDRARLVRPDFALTPQNEGVVDEICTRLDGIPLALEMAASRLRALSVGELQARLHERFHLLTGGIRTALPRQQTLRALIDWSYDLLADDEKVLLARLSVFAGGWTRDAAEAVCGDPARGLASLVDQSLVVAFERDGAERYRFLETVRQYAADRLVERGETEALRRRHRDYFLAWAEAIGPARNLPPNVVRMAPEHDNLRAALEHCDESDDGAEAGFRLLRCLLAYWDVCGYVREAEERVERMLQRPPSAPSSAWLDIRGAQLLFHEVRGADPAAVRRRWEALLDDYRALGDPVGEMMTRRTLGELCLNSGALESGDRYAREALDLCREIGDRRFLPALLVLSGHVAYHRGEWAAARARFEEAHALDEAAGQRYGTAPLWIGYACLALGDPARAETVFRECAARFAVGARSWLAHVFDGLARTAAARGDHARAARLLGAAERPGETLRSTVFVELLPFLGSLAPSLRERLGEDAFAAAYAAGRALTLDQALALATDVPNLG